MTIKEVENILKGNFEDPADREYWEDKLKELKIKEATIKQNEIYFRKNIVYDR